MHCPHRFKEGRAALAFGNVVRGEPAGIAPLQRASWPKVTAFCRQPIQRLLKACIPWGSLGSLCSPPHVWIPKVFSNKHPERKASDGHFEFVYSLPRQHVFHLGVPLPPSEGQGHTLPPLKASISPLARSFLLRGAQVSVFCTACIAAQG